MNSMHALRESYFITLLAETRNAKHYIMQLMINMTPQTGNRAR